MNLYVAEMTTEHFSFVTIGKSKEAAIESMAEGFARHLVEYQGETREQVILNWIDCTFSLSTIDDTRGKSPEDEFATLLNEWYGINVMHFTDYADVMRDGDVMRREQ